MKTHDYREGAVRWGHNHYFEPQDNNTFYGPCWTSTRVSKGDLIFWSTNYGTCEAEVIEVKAAGDPSDMYWVRSRVVRRHANPDIVSQEELDEAFGFEEWG